MPVVHLVALGTRGDVAPAVTVAAQLRARGHDVLVHGADRYAGLAAAESVPYRAAGDVDLFGSTPTSRRLTLAQAGITYALLRRRYRAWSAGLWARLRGTDPRDVLLCGLGSAALASAWRERGGRAALLLVGDVRPPGPPASGQPGRLTVSERCRRNLMWPLTMQMSAAPDAVQHDAPRHAARPGAARHDTPLPTVLAVSRTLAGDAPLPAHVVRTGHLVVPAPTAAAPRPATPLVYAGLGSLTDPSGRALHRLADAARAVGCGLVTDAAPLAGIDPPRPVTIAEETDHRRLFGQVDGVLHHGGAGTTVTGLLAARPTAMIPMLGDQFALARRVHALGAGPRPLHRHVLTDRALRRTLAALADPPERHRRAARELADALAAEDGVQRTTDACEQIIEGGRSVCTSS